MLLILSMAGLAALVALTVVTRANPINFSTDTFEIIGGINTDQPEMRRSNYKGKEEVDFQTSCLLK